MDCLRFTLFNRIVFDVKYPDALIEAYCFQCNFFAKYDLKRPEGDRRFEFVRYIGARLEPEVLDRCKAQINQYKDFNEVDEKGLDWFLKIATTEERNHFTSRLAELTHELDRVPRVSFSKATKILHTRYPNIIPIIDNRFQEEYRTPPRPWKKGDLHQLFKDYYENFMVKETWDNLDELHTNLSNLNLTKVRIFDILWWSFLKSKNKDFIEKNINWKTIKEAAD